MLFSKLRNRLRTLIGLLHSTDAKAGAIVEGVANETRLLNEKCNAIIQGLDNQSRLLDSKLDAVVAALDNQSLLLGAKLDALIGALDTQRTGAAATAPAASVSGVATAADASGLPLLVDEKTYNWLHPAYDPAAVRNFPGKILNSEFACQNPVYAELKKLAKGDQLPYEDWAPVLEMMLAEVKAVPEAHIVFQRRDELEQYVAELSRRYSARYVPGWVGLEDGLYLYWLVRRLKPKTIVQCGVCNGMSSAFIMLGLAKNGADGELYAIDIPPVFNASDPAWTIPGKVYGVVIPEGKTSGWMVPEAYGDRFTIQTGDSKLLLPKLVDSLPAIDMFYHDSNHTYEHMMFEFRQAKRKLTPGGLIIADDIPCAAALWDFADEQKVPAYNFRGQSGVAFF